MPRERIDGDLGCCPTCRRPFRSVLDYPAVIVERFEELPVPQSEGATSARERKRFRSPIERLYERDRGPDIINALSRDVVRRYFNDLSKLVGQEVDPQRLRPGWKAHDDSRTSHPIPETKLFLALLESDASSENQGIVEVQVLCDGFNMGSAGGAMLWVLGPVARIRYRGLLASPEETSDAGARRTNDPGENP